MRKVLIVEPKPADARRLKESLRQAGLGNASTVLTNSVEARQHLADRDHNSILMLNIHSADSESMALLDWLRGQTFYPELLVVALGERSELRTVVEACERGAHTFLIKPVRAEDIKTLAERYPDYWTRGCE